MVKSQHLALAPESDMGDVSEADLGAANPPPGSVQPAPNMLTPQRHEWLNEHLEEAERTKVSLIHNWPAWSNKYDRGHDATSWSARGACLTALRIVMEAAPVFTAKDLLVVERAGLDGKASTQEVWTNRAFAKHELVLVPVSHLVFDKLWTKEQCASVVMPENGHFAWPTRRTVGLDGRNQGLIDKDGSGTLFWNITRTPDQAASNLILEHTQVILGDVSVTFPHQKRRRVAYGASDTPQVPVLVNPKAIEKRTMLVALEDKTIKKAMDKDKEEKVKAAIQKKAEKDKA